MFPHAHERIGRRSYAIPVEVKKNSHSQLWSAIETQLIAKYTRDHSEAAM